jgi:hypothetical protein
MITTFAPAKILQGNMVSFGSYKNVPWYIEQKGKLKVLKPFSPKLRGKRCHKIKKKDFVVDKYFMLSDARKR